MRHDRFEIAVQLVHRRTGPQAADAHRELEAARGIGGLLGAKRKRQPGVDLAAREAEALGHHADHSEGDAVETDVAVLHVRAPAEARDPEPVAQHRDAIVAADRFVFREPAAERGLRAEHVEQRRRRQRDQHALGPALRAERARLGAHDREIPERRRLNAPLEVVRDRRAGILDPGPRIRVVDDDQPVAVGIRQRTKKQTAQHAEDGAVRADREREHEDGQTCVQRPLAERPQRVAQILEPSAHELIARHG